MAFSGCQALERADLGACVLADTGRNFLASRAFENSGLESVVLPSALRVIRGYTFFGCKNLKSVTFGENPMMEEIGAKAFFDCGLESFPFLPSLKRVGDMAFGRCCALKEF